MQEATHTLTTMEAIRPTTYSLHPRQKWAFYSPATEVLYGGAAGGGKSFLLRCSAIRWCESVPGIQVYLFRRTYPDLRDNHLRGPRNFFDLLAGALQDGTVKYNKAENEFVWIKTGSRIRLCHCQYEDDVIHYQGAEIHVLMFDELTHFTDHQYRFLRSRCRFIGMHPPAAFRKKLPRIESASNPGSIGHAWVKRAFIKERQPFSVYDMPPEEGGMLRQFVPAKLADNPTMAEDDPNYMAKLQGLGDPDLVRAMAEGDWDIYAGQFFDEWRRDVHILDYDWEPPAHYNWFFGYDHGYAHPAVFYACCVDEHSTVYVWKEVGCVRKHPDEIAAAIRTGLGNELFAKVRNIQAGHDCFTKMKDGGPSIADQFLALKENKIVLNRAAVDRINGAAQVRAFLQWKPTLDAAGQLTILGPRMRVHPSCRHLIDCLPSLIHDPNRGEDVLKVDGSPADPWAGDDPYDAIRYGLMSRPKPPKLEPEFIAKTYDQRVQDWLEKKRKAMSKKLNRPRDPILGNRC